MLLPAAHPTRSSCELRGASPRRLNGRSACLPYLSAWVYPFEARLAQTWCKLSNGSLEFEILRRVRAWKLRIKTKMRTRWKMGDFQYLPIFIHPSRFWSSKNTLVDLPSVMGALDWPDWWDLPSVMGAVDWPDWWDKCSFRPLNAVSAYALAPLYALQSKRVHD